MCPLRAFGEPLGFAGCKACGHKVEPATASLRAAEGWHRSEIAALCDELAAGQDPGDQTWIFHEVDVARVELILDIRQEFAIDEEALPLVLGLLDQVYELRRHLRRMCDALAAQPPEVQAAVRRALPPRTGPEIPHD